MSLYYEDEDKKPKHTGDGMPQLERFDEKRTDVQCLLCNWKGRWGELMPWERSKSEFVEVCPNCSNAYLITPEELKEPDFWTTRPGLKEKIAKARIKRG